jgi:hypothetical protein
MLRDSMRVPARRKGLGWRPGRCRGPIEGRNLYNGAAGNQGYQELAAYLVWLHEGSPTYTIPPSDSASHASVTCDKAFIFFCVTYSVHFTHADVTSIAFVGLVGELATFAGIMCGTRFCVP